jgi:hypothetical protein
MPLNDIATEQTKATEKTQAATNQMSDYLATHPDATIRYHASDIVKLPQPQLRTRTYTQTCQSNLRATQVRAALSHAFAVTYQNRITDKP